MLTITKHLFSNTTYSIFEAKSFKINYLTLKRTECTLKLKWSYSTWLVPR
jgi:hypothetical protein